MADTVLSSRWQPPPLSHLLAAVWLLLLHLGSYSEAAAPAPVFTNVPFESNQFVPYLANQFPTFNVFSNGLANDTAGFCTVSSYGSPTMTTVQYPGPLGLVRMFNIGNNKGFTIGNIPHANTFTYSTWMLWPAGQGLNNNYQQVILLRSGPISKSLAPFSIVMQVTANGASATLYVMKDYTPDRNNVGSGNGFFLTGPVPLTGPLHLTVTLTGGYPQASWIAYSTTTGLPIASRTTIGTNTTFLFDYLLPTYQYSHTIPTNPWTLDITDVDVGGYGYPFAIWDTYLFIPPVPLPVISTGMYQNPLLNMYPSDPCLYLPVSPYCNAGTCSTVGGGPNNSPVIDYTCNGLCLPGWSGNKCNTPACYAPAYATRMNMGNCTCSGNYYDLVYGQTTQLLRYIQQGLPASCALQCTNGFLYQNPFTLTWTCVAGSLTGQQGPCQNFGQYYQNSDGSYYCKCQGLWTGQNCTVNSWTYHACDTNLYTTPCANNGICYDTGNGTYGCDCSQTGFSGNQCQTPIDICSTTNVVLCKNGGSCITQGPNTYTCDCAGGYGGVVCDQQIDWCVISDFNPLGNTICKNGAQCANSDPPGNVQCVCQHGFTGQYCQTPYNNCTSDAIYPCKNGAQCVSTGPAKYQCICPLSSDGKTPGYKGTYCETMVDFCNTTQFAISPCQHNGQCQTTGPASYYCNCPTGYYGDYCEITIDYCASKPCQNSGVCTSLPASGTYVCNCGLSSNFYGRNCTQVYDICAPNPSDPNSAPCLHGSCQLTATGFECICPPNYSGVFCQYFTAPSPAPGPVAFIPYIISYVSSTSGTQVPKITPSPAPTQAPLPVTTFGYTPHTGDYVIYFNIQVEYLLVFANYQAAIQQIQNDLITAIGLPASRSYILNVTNIGNSNTGITTAILASSVPTDRTPNLFYALLVQQLSDPNSQLFTHSVLLSQTQNCSLLSPTPNNLPATVTVLSPKATTNQYSTISFVWLGGLATATIAYAVFVIATRQFYLSHKKNV